MDRDRLFLSIVIPVYNAERFLRECLDSCFSEDAASESYEVICVNDGSADCSAEILHDYENNHTNLVVIHQENQGVSAARNRGIDEARGKYIWFVDADDFIRPGFIEEICSRYRNDEMKTFPLAKTPCSII